MEGRGRGGEVVLDWVEKIILKNICINFKANFFIFIFIFVLFGFWFLVLIFVLNGEHYYFYLEQKRRKGTAFLIYGRKNSSFTTKTIKRLSQFIPF